jgi:hypothetical protein
VAGFEGERRSPLHDAREMWESEWFAYAFHSVRYDQVRPVEGQEDAEE